MPQYTVPLAGGGEMRVNASSPQAAADNVRSQGGTPASGGGGGGGGGGGSAPSGGGGGSGTYQTVNGLQTTASMEQQLRAVGWGGGEDVATAYARTTGGAVTPAGGGGGGGGSAPGGTPGGTVTGTNVAAGQMLLDKAQAAAYQAYLNAKLALDSDQEAYQKAAQAAATAIAEAGVTGTFQGQPTQAAIKQAADIAAQQAATMLSYATTYGVWGTPTQGQQTLAGQQQGFNQAQEAAKLTGWYTPYTYTPPGGTAGGGQFGDAPGAPPGYQAGQPIQTLAGWQAQQDAAQNYLKLLSGLRGPADWAQYNKVIGATPGGMQDLVRAAAGQYIPGGGATTGVQPTPVTLGSFVNQATGGPPDQNSQAVMSSLVAPNQLAPQAWNNLTPSQQQMLLGAWESQGYSKEDAQALFNQSLPKYAAGTPSAGTFRLQ